jgi:radical SAM superfamily enzyme YgiQ (UPF0313 family)
VNVALVNTNRIRPPIAPIGLDYVAETLDSRGHTVQVLDLCWPDDPSSAIDRFFSQVQPDLVGVTLRNTDDCAFTGRQSFVGDLSRYVAAIRACTGAPIVVGGVGFSVMPERVLETCDADAGVWGDGECAMAELADRIGRGRDWADVPGLVVWREDGWGRNPPAPQPLDRLPTMRRCWVDNPRYFREGGQAGFETKRGCTGLCTYCADPVAKGHAVRARPPTAVADELEHLLSQGIDHLHTCDSEFNIVLDHAADVCRELIRRGLGERLSWYAYCAPRPFSPELADLMGKAGCVGVNFGVDSGDAGMLRRLKRAFSPRDILNAARWCRDAGIVTMFDLLLGSPGESRESVVGTIDLMREAKADVVGVAVGVRIYPGTELGELAAGGALDSGLLGESDPLDPQFYLEPAVADEIFDLLDGLVGEDERFLFFDPTRPERNYNYNANERLTAAIREGYRGAYWDILRRYR